MIVPQDFSIVYRAPGVVDLLMPKRVGIDGYCVMAAKTFNGPFVPLFTAEFGGSFFDPTVDRGKLTEMSSPNRIRAVFNPNTYGLGGIVNAGILDSQQFWLQFQPVVAGVPGAVAAVVLVLSPLQRYSASRVAVSGTAPSVASVAESLPLVFGARRTGFTLLNQDGSNSLFVAFEEGGPEVEIPALSPRHALSGEDASTVMWVRGSGAGGVAFCADFMGNMQ